MTRHTDAQEPQELDRDIFEAQDPRDEAYDPNDGVVFDDGDEAYDLFKDEPECDLVWPLDPHDYDDWDL